MSTEQNKALARRYAQELTNFFRTGDLSFVDRLFTKGALLHMPGIPPNVNTKQIFSSLRIAMPDFETKIEDLVAEGDKVALRITWSGTHKGDMMGIPATGKHVKVTEMQFYRIEDEKIAERWVEADLFGMLQQMGLVPTPGKG
jgi:steroid delta-isomerase-like uncharacterized protein